MCVQFPVSVGGCLLMTQHSGTAVYRGVALKKVLKVACGGILPEAKHLEFIGADTYFKYVCIFLFL